MERKVRYFTTYGCNGEIMSNKLTKKKTIMRKKKQKRNKIGQPLSLVMLTRRHAVKESKKAYSRKGNKPKLFQDVYKHPGRNFLFSSFF